jgi:hypothetical protein
MSEGTSAPAQQADPGPAHTPPTQADLDAIARAEAKYAGFDQYKSDSEELARLRDADKSEAQRQADTLKAAEQARDAALAEVSSLKAAADLAALRADVARAKAIPPESLALLAGATKDELEASADLILSLVGPRGPKPNPSQGRTGSAPVTPSIAETRQRHAAAYQKKNK